MLKMAAPYLAIAAFLIVFHDAWLAILAYHAQIVWWSRGPLLRSLRSKRTPLAWFVVPSALAGPAAYLLLQRLPGIHLASWLAVNQLTGWALFLMVPYYAIVNPVLEEVFWTPLRESTPIAHVAFAGYHVLLLAALLPPLWLALVFVVLSGTSWVWQRLSREAGSLLPAIASHAAADLGIIVVALLLR
jgi:hypothetical protein